MYRKKRYTNNLELNNSGIDAGRITEKKTSMYNKMESKNDAAVTGCMDYTEFIFGTYFILVLYTHLANQCSSMIIPTLFPSRLMKTSAFRFW